MVRIRVIDGFYHKGGNKMRDSAKKKYPASSGGINYRTLVTGIFISIAVSALLLLLFAAILLNTGVPDAVSGLLPYFAVGIGCLVGGFLVARWNRRMGLVTGAMIAGSLFVILLIIGFCFPGSALNLNSVWIMLATVFVGGEFGSIVGAGMKKRR